MTARAFHLIVNPRSGGGRAGGVGDEVAEQLRALGAQVRLSHSPSVEAAADLVADTAAAGEVCVGVGGDGLVGSLATAVHQHGVDFGIAPGGRGNDFARQLGLPKDPAKVAALLVSGAAKPTDAILANDRVVVGSVYAGVDSATSEIVNASHRLPALLQYQLGGLRGLLTFAPRRFCVTIDGTPHEYTGLMAVAANSGYYGKGMHIAPDADVHDGLLDVVMVSGTNRARFIAKFPTLYTGAHVKSDEVQVLRGREVTIEAEDVPAYGDGDYLAPLPVTIRLVPGALSMILP